MTISPTMISVVAATTIALLASGCSTYAASRYTISADTVSTLRSFRGQARGIVRQNIDTEEQEEHQ
jgi:hypothetical protein